MFSAGTTPSERDKSRHEIGRSIPNGESLDGGAGNSEEHALLTPLTTSSARGDAGDITATLDEVFGSEPRRAGSDPPGGLRQKASVPKSGTEVQPEQTPLEVLSRRRTNSSWPLTGTDSSRWTPGWPALQVRVKSRGPD